MEKRISPRWINLLEENEIFVFGSNLEGFHGAGAADMAMDWGAVWGQGVGLQGQTYAIPTMHGGVETIAPYVNDFLDFAVAHPELKFLVTEIGCGIAGFKPKKIAPLFRRAVTENIENIYLPESFWDAIENLIENEENKSTNNKEIKKSEKLNQFMDKFGVYLSTALCVGVIIFLAVCWNDITTLQRLVGVYFIAISIHVWEEMKLPGGFIDMVTDNLKLNLKNVGAAKLLLFAVEILIAIVPLFFPQIIWLCVAPLLLGFVETLAHLAATRMNKKQKFYSPGMITALCVMLPVSVYGFYYIIANGIMEQGIWWLWSVLYLLGIVLVAQMIIVKSNGMKYAEFIGNAGKKLFGKSTDN